MKSSTWWLCSSLVCALALSGCGGSAPAHDDAGPLDGSMMDASTDASTDAGPDGGEPACTMITPWVATHVTSMATTGWRAVHAENVIVMHGCSGATTALECLAGYPLSSTETWAESWTEAMPEASIRILRELGHATFLRSRSSPDGRFVMHGSGTDGYAVDLERGVDVVLEGALYGPSFLPDGSGFMMQAPSAQVCTIAVLTDEPASVDFTETGCDGIAAIGLEQDVGRALGGGDYFAVTSDFVTDSGGATVTLSDPEPMQVPGADMDVTPLLFNGTTFAPKPELELPIPYESNVVVSPSARLVLGLHSDGDERYFALRRLDLEPSGDSYDGTTTEVARYCVRGSQPSFSYDERWVVYHHYVEADDWDDLGFASASDAGFVALRTGGAANLFLLDLLTGESRRITTMGPGQYAVYPHFRSDGWIYAVVRDRVRDEEVLIASDAALLLE